MIDLSKRENREKVWEFVEDDIRDLKFYQRLDVYWNENKQELWSVVLKIYLDNIEVKEGNEYVGSFLNVFHFWDTLRPSLQEKILSLPKEERLKIEEDDDEFKKFLRLEYGKYFIEDKLNIDYH